MQQEGLTPWAQARLRVQAVAEARPARTFLMTHTTRQSVCCRVITSGNTQSESVHLMSIFPHWVDGKREFPSSLCREFREALGIRLSVTQHACTSSYVHGGPNFRSSTWRIFFNPPFPTTRNSGGDTTTTIQSRFLLH